MSGKEKVAWGKGGEKMCGMEGARGKGGAVSVKASTEEHMGFTGRGEGIAAHAVCLLTERTR